MYITKVVLKSVRCFEMVEIDLDSSQEAKWQLILGVNGTGKTTVLRSIAMGLCDQTSASGLLSDVPGKFARSEQGSAEITVDLAAASGRGYRTITTITKEGSRETLRRDLLKLPEEEPIKPEEFPWKALFVCGYGAGRGVAGTESYEEYSPYYSRRIGKWGCGGGE